MVHYPADNSAVLEDPDVTHFEPGEAPVMIKASHGEISNNGENIYLSGSVDVRRLPVITSYSIHYTKLYEC